MFAISYVLSVLISFGYIFMQYSNLRELVNLSNTMLFNGGTLNTVSLYNDSYNPPKYVINLKDTCVGTWDCVNKMCSVYTLTHRNMSGYVAITPNIRRGTELKCTNNMWNWVETSEHYVISFVLIILSFICIIVSNILIGGIVIYNDYNPKYDNNILVVNAIATDPHKRWRKFLCYILMGILRFPAVISLIVFSFYTKPYLLKDKGPSEIVLFSIINNVIFSLIYVVDYIKVTHSITKIIWGAT